jgi:hypothetical protein
MTHAGGSRDIAAGVPVILFGAAGLWLARAYPFGVLTDMGPGFLPVIASLALVATGIAISLGHRESGSAGRLAWRASLFVFAAMIAFGLAIERLGLVVSTFGTTVICAYATSEARWKEAVPLGVGFAIFAVLVFVYGLGQPVPVWWWDR